MEYDISDQAAAHHRKSQKVRKGLPAVLRLIKGGKGSGNFGHSGRPGERGGSTADGGPSDKSRKHLPPPKGGEYDENLGRVFYPEVKAPKYDKEALKLGYKIPKPVIDAAKLLQEDSGGALSEEKAYFAAKAAHEYTDGGLSSVGDKGALDNFIVNSPKSAYVDHYRGIHLNSLKGFEGLKPGDSYRHKDAQGFSTSKSKAEKFIRGESDEFGDTGSKKVMLHVKGPVKSGASVKHLSAVPKDEEVLFRAKTNFKVLSVKRTKNRIDVTLQESVNKVKKGLPFVVELMKGGKGSGNYGHEGRKDQVGGSGPGAPKGDNLEHKGPKKGTVPGGIYKDKTTGKEYIVKEYKSPLQAASEAITNDLYRLADIPAADSHVVKMGDKLVSAAEMIPNIKDGSAAALDKVRDKVAIGYGVDALAANWDVVGLSHDNIGIDKSGNPIRLDNGGSLTFRAQGGSKDFPGNKVAELDTLLDSGKNANTSALYNKAFAEDPKLKIEAMERVGKISDKEIDSTVHRNYKLAGADEKLADSIAQGLKDRRDIILEQAAKLKEKVKVDEKKAEEKKAAAAEKKAAKEAAIAAGTYVAQEKPRKGVDELNSANRNAVNAAMKKEKSELYKDAEKYYASTGIDQFIGGKTNKEWKEHIATHPEIMRTKAATQAWLVKDGYLKYDEATGKMSTVTLHRGVGVPRGVAMKWKEGDQVDFGYLACFSESEKKSLSFAKSNGTGSAIKSYKDWKKENPGGTKDQYKKTELPVLFTAINTPGRRIAGSWRLNAGKYKSFQGEQENTLWRPHRFTIKSTEVKSDGSGKYIHAIGEFRG